MVVPEKNETASLLGDVPPFPFSVVGSSRLAGPKAGLLVDQQHDTSVTLSFVPASVPTGRGLCQPEEVYIDALTAYGRSSGDIS